MKSTTDIWFAAVLRIKGYELSRCVKTDRGRGAFEFDIDDDTWNKEKIEFYNSETNRVKQETTALKDLLF